MFNLVWVFRNVVFLFFYQELYEFFRGVRIEIVFYIYDDVIDEVFVIGLIDQQIDEILFFILKKIKEEVRYEYVVYLERVFREVVVNVFYYRSYEYCYCDLIKIYIKLNCIDVISYFGFNFILKEEYFIEGSEVLCVLFRNRRIVEFFKDRKLVEGRFIGVRIIFKFMKQNKNLKLFFFFSLEYFYVRFFGYLRYIVNLIF